MIAIALAIQGKDTLSVPQGLRRSPARESRSLLSVAKSYRRARCTPMHPLYLLYLRLLPVIQALQARTPRSTCDTVRRAECTRRSSASGGELVYSDCQVTMTSLDHQVQIRPDVESSLSRRMACFAGQSLALGLGSARAREAAGPVARASR